MFLERLIYVFNDSVWWFIEYVVEDYLLVFCDFCFVLEQDLVECDYIRRKFKGVILYVYFNEVYQWNYLGNYNFDEVLMLKMFDLELLVRVKSKLSYICWSVNMVIKCFCGCILLLY